MKTIVYPSHINGQINPHPSKSMIHRILLCSAFAKSNTTIKEPPLSDDIKRTLNIICALGASYKVEQQNLIITPIKKFKRIDKVLDCGDSATTLRMFAPIISYFNKGITFRISDQLKSRIKKSDFAFLDLDYNFNGNEITFGSLVTKPNYTIDEMHTTQSLSGLLFLAPFLDQPVTITIKAKTIDPYILLTLEVLKIFGVKFSILQQNPIIIKTKQGSLEAMEQIKLRNDYSNAAGLILASIMNGPTKVIDKLQLPLLGDEAIIDIVTQMGCHVEIKNSAVEINPKKLQPIQFDFSLHPDLAPVVIAACTLIDGQSTFTGLSRLIDKESNRLDATITLLKQLGANISYLNDTLTVIGPTSYEGGITLSSYNDHRMVFMLSLIGSFAKKPITILDSQAINKSYPNYFNDFALLGGKYQNE